MRTSNDSRASTNDANANADVHDAKDDADRDADREDGGETDEDGEAHTPTAHYNASDSTPRSAKPVAAEPHTDDTTSTHFPVHFPHLLPTLPPTTQKTHPTDSYTTSSPHPNTSPPKASRSYVS